MGVQVAVAGSVRNLIEQLYYKPICIYNYTWTFSVALDSGMLSWGTVIELDVRKEHTWHGACVLRVPTCCDCAAGSWMHELGEKSSSWMFVKRIPGVRALGASVLQLCCGELDARTGGKVIELDVCKEDTRVPA
jgi:hypothetical protein